MMSDRCVACGEVAEGKPLYKKLGSSDCQTEVFKALHEMQLISLPYHEKNNYYICWDCDETVAEEYVTFVSNEAKRKAIEEKRKKQDEARNIKLKKKLKMAFKKAHEDKLRARGITPPASKYKMKEKEREENKYHASHCLLCKSSFEENQGRGYQRYTLEKMVDDEYDVADVLQILRFPLDVTEEVKKKRFMCCQCYNKIRRNYKAKNHNVVTSTDSSSFQVPTGDSQPSEKAKDIFKRRPTAEEHAAEIAKLIPPSLANMYKVVTQDEKDSNQGKPSSDQSSSDESEGKRGHNNDVNASPISKMNSKGFYGISASRTPAIRPPNIDNFESANEIVDYGVCNLCGMSFYKRPKSFWQSLSSPVSSVSGVTISDALTLLESHLADAGPAVRKMQLVCTPCYTRVCTGFRSQILQRIAQKKGIDVKKIDLSSLKVKVMDNEGDDGSAKMNGSYDEGKVRTASSDDKHATEKKKDKLRRENGNSTCIRFQRSHSSRNLSQRNGDLDLVKLINRSRHLQHKGKVVTLYSGIVNVANIKEILPSGALRKREPVKLEHLVDVFQYSNLYRNLKNKPSWSLCILCQKTNLGIDKTTHWLDDPVAPPNLMVPLRWAHLSLGNSKNRSNIATEDGKVCPDCHSILKVKFGKFVGTKVAFSHGLTSEKIILDKYKVSFDSNAMNIVADPLESVKESSKKKHKEDRHKKSHKENHSDRKHKDVPNGKTLTTVTDMFKKTSNENKGISSKSLERQESVINKLQDTLSMDLDLSETSDSDSDDKTKKLSKGSFAKAEHQQNSLQDDLSSDSKHLNDGQIKSTAVAEESSKSAEESSKSAEESSKSAEESSKSAEESSKSAAVPEKSSKLTVVPEESSKSAEESFKSTTIAEESSKSAEESSKSAEESSKSAEESSKSAEESSKSAAVPEKSSKLTVVPEESSKSAEESFKSTTIAEESSKSTAVTEQSNKSTAVTGESNKSTAVTEESNKSPALTEESSKSTALVEENSKSTAVAEESSKSTAVAEESSKSSTVVEDSSKLSQEKRISSVQDSVDKPEEVNKCDEKLDQSKNNKNCEEQEVEKSEAENQIDTNKESSSQDAEREITTSLEPTKSINSNESKLSEKVEGVKTKLNESDEKVNVESTSQSLTENSEMGEVSSKLKACVDEERVIQNKKVDNVSGKKQLLNSLNSEKIKSPKETTPDSKETTPDSSNVSESCEDLNDTVEDELFSDRDLNSSGDAKQVVNVSKKVDSVQQQSTIINNNNSELTREKNHQIKDNRLNVDPTVHESPLTENLLSIKSRQWKRGRKRKKRRSVSTVKSQQKSLSDLIDQGKATSYDVVAEYLNAQRNKIRELINPSNDGGLNSIEFKLKTSRIDSQDDARFSEEKEKFLHSDSLRLEDDYQAEAMSEDMVAPFAQRKKRRNQPLNEDSSSSTPSSSQHGSDVNVKKATYMCLGSIWHSLQGISLDDLLTKDTHQPLRLSQYNVGLVLALNDIRVHIGASLEDLVSWLKNLLPLELKEKGLELSIEKFSAYLFSLNQGSDVCDTTKLKKVLSEELFVSSAKENSNANEMKLTECFIEDVMINEDCPSKLRWDHFLAPVNMDNLIIGKASRVSWSEFNNGLLYALWRVNKMLHCDEKNLIKWLSLTSTHTMKETDYVSMAKAADGIHAHLEKFPKDINRLVAPIVMKTNKNSKENSAIKNDAIKANDKCVSNSQNEHSFNSKADESKKDKSKVFNHSVKKRGKLSRKRDINDSFEEDAPKKKMARVLPQPSNEEARERMKEEGGSKSSHNLVKNSKQETENLLKLTNKGKSKERMTDDERLIVNRSSKDSDNLPIISDVVGATKFYNNSSGESLCKGGNDQLKISLGTTIVASNVNTVSSFNLNNLCSQPKSSVPLIPVISAQGVMTMLPIQVGINSQFASLSNNQLASLSNNQLATISNNQLASISNNQLVSLSNNQLPSISNNQLASISNNQLASLSNNQLASISNNQLASLSNVSAANQKKDAPTESKNLETKVSLLERQLEEIQKQNSKLLEMNQKLLEKNMNQTTDNSEAKKDKIVNDKTSVIGGKMKEIDSSTHSRDHHISKKPKLTFEEALNYKYSQKK